MSTVNSFFKPFILCAVETAELFRRAVCEDCRTCAAQISDLNRQTLSELAEGERAFRVGSTQMSASRLRIAYAIGHTVSKGFAAALLLPGQLPILPALEQEVKGIAELAAYLERLSLPSERDSFPYYSMHLCANRCRGAHALLLTNYCASDSGKWLLPLAAALEAWRGSLELACVSLASDG